MCDSGAFFSPSTAAYFGFKLSYVAKNNAAARQSGTEKGRKKEIHSPPGMDPAAAADRPL